MLWSHFLRFSPIFCEQIGVFLRNQCYDQIFAQFSSVLSQKRQFFGPIYSKKIIPSVPLTAVWNWAAFVTSMDDATTFSWDCASVDGYSFVDLKFVPSATPRSFRTPVQVRTTRVARFFLAHDTKTGKNVPNKQKMYQMVIRYPIRYSKWT
jgi:hypothetical protein